MGGLGGKRREGEMVGGGGGVRGLAWGNGRRRGCRGAVEVLMGESMAR